MYYYSTLYNQHINGVCLLKILIEIILKNCFYFKFNYVIISTESTEERKAYGVVIAKIEYQ